MCYVRASFYGYLLTGALFADNDDGEACDDDDDEPEVPGCRPFLGSSRKPYRSLPPRIPLCPFSVSGTQHVSCVMALRRYAFLKG